MGRTNKALMDAKTLADLCLGQLAEDPAQLAEFMSISGYDPQGLRAALASGELGGGLIDYVASNEPLLLALCANNGLRPVDFMAVWHKLNPAH